MKRFIFLNSHPIQYFAPLYKKMSQLDDVALEVFYCSNQGVAEKMDEQFGKVFKWDIPLLEGYSSHFFRNYSLRPSLTSFGGLQNWGVVFRLFRSPKSILIINGWQFFIYVLAIVAGRIAGHTVCLRAESPLSRELSGSGRKKWLKRILIGKLLFRFPQYFLYIGQQNKAFYKYMDVAESKLIFSPYCVDNERFNKYYPTNEPKKKEIRSKLGLPHDSIIVLYSGKFIAKKRPLDLLEAWRQINTKNAWLVLMGDGELRPEIEEFVSLHNLHNVSITGFINQSVIPMYYAAADIFTMLSDADETWGLSTNEAMNLGLALLISDTTGCSLDLVSDGMNGYRFELGDISSLRAKLQKLISDNDFRHQAGLKSLEIVRQYSYNTVIQNLLSIPQ